MVPPKSSERIGSRRAVARENQMPGPGLEFSDPSLPAFHSLSLRLTHRKISSACTQVVALYKLAGLSLDNDLGTLAAAPRISADASAQDYVNTYITLTDKLNGVPVLSLHTTGDGNVVVENERAYKDAVMEAGDRKLLRQVYVHRAGHCNFTPAEMIAAFQALVHRIDTGRWGHLGPKALTREAEALGVGSSDFVRFRPKPFPRRNS